MVILLEMRLKLRRISERQEYQDGISSINSRNIGRTLFRYRIWLAGIRRISFAPVIVLSDTPEQDTHSMVQLGADICVSSKHPYSIIADLAQAQLRRYTEYNHYTGPGSIEVSPFGVGDIFIDPPRRIVEVRGQRVDFFATIFHEKSQYRVKL